MAKQAIDKEKQRLARMLANHGFPAKVDGENIVIQYPPVGSGIGTQDCIPATYQAVKEFLNLGTGSA